MATNTTNTFTNHTGNGTEVNFSISFSYILTSDIDVTVAGVLKTLGTHYTISGSTVTFTSGNVPANGAAIKFQRDTSISTKAVDFQDGSVLTEQDLDNNTNQVLFAQQEITDKLGGIEEGATGDQTAAEIRTLVESASDSNVFTDDDHSKLNGIEAGATADQTVSEIKSLIAGSPLDASHLAANSVDSSELVDGSVDTSHLSADCVTNAKIADNSINSEHYVDGSIDHVHLANDIIDSDNIQDNAVNSEHYVDGSIDHVHLSNDCVDGDNIADNSINSEHYVDGSIDTVHLSANLITNPKIANDAIDTAHIRDSNVTTPKIADDAVTTGKIADAELKTLAGMQSGTASKLADSTALTSDIADLNQLDGMAKQTTISDDDTKFPTSGAVVDYVAAQLAPIGGLEVIATDAAFPNTQPAAGVVISIADAGGLVVDANGTSVTARTLNGTTVTINNFASNFNSSTVDAGVAIMVSSTGSGQVYNYHKATLKEADLLNLSNDINDFAARYRVTTGEPTSNNDEGDLIYDKNADKMKVFDSTTNAFKEVTSVGDFKFLFLCPTGGSGSPTINGSIATYDLREGGTSGSAASVTNAAQLIVSVNGVIQKPNTGTSAPSEGFAMVDSNTIIFGANLPTGAEVFVIQIGSAIALQVPADDTVATAKLQNGSVTSAKIQDDAVTSAKIQDSAITEDKIHGGAVTQGKLANLSVTTNKIAVDAINNSHISNNSVNTAEIYDEAITLAKLEHGTSSNDGKFLRANNGADPTFETINTTPADGSITQAKVNFPVSNRNIIINGAMQICQRFNANSMNNISGSTHTYHVDRFKAFNSNGGILGQEWQPDHAPAGYYYSLRLKCVSADTSIDGLTFLSQVIEDKNIYNLHYGSSGAVTCTLSFWIKSNLTGTFSVGLINDTQGSRGFIAEYTISASNTWEKKSITVVGDTTGTWNAGGLRVQWALAIQSDRQTSTLNSWQNTSSVLYSSSNQPNFMGNTNNYMNITGVQFEVGSVSTEFDHKTITEDQRLCERYYRESLNGGIRNAINNNGDRIPVPAFRTQMRASPTMIASNFTEFSSATSRTITGFHGVGSNGGGYAQLNSTPSNGVYFFAHANAEL